MRQYLANDLIITVICLAGLAVAGIDGVFMGNILLWASMSVAVCLVYRFLYLRSMRFVITGEQFIYEHGVFRRTRDFLELYRIVDFREESSFLQQLLCLKTVQIYSGDRSTPRLDMVGMDIRENLIPFIRERVGASRKRNGIYEITNRKNIDSHPYRPGLHASEGAACRFQPVGMARPRRRERGHQRSDTGADRRADTDGRPAEHHRRRVHQDTRVGKEILRLPPDRSGFASSLKASATLYEDGVRIFITLGKLKNAIGSNPQGIVATMSMNNLYLETATELISVYTLLREAIATGGRTNMLTGAERSQTLWALSDKLSEFSKKLNRLYLNIRYYKLTDVWNSVTAGMLDRDIGDIADDAFDRWKRAARAIE